MISFLGIDKLILLPGQPGGLCLLSLLLLGQPLLLLTEPLLLDVKPFLLLAKPQLFLLLNQSHLFDVLLDQGKNCFVLKQ